MRRAVLQIHLWLGISIGLLWAMQGLSGAFLVFHRELDRLTSPAVTAGPTAPIDSILTSASNAAGGAPITRLSFSDRYRDRMEASYKDAGKHPRAVLLESATARVIGDRAMEPVSPLAGSVTRWLLMFHMSLLSGRAGEVFIGASGLMLFSTVLAGLWLAWPPRTAWKFVYSWSRWPTAMQRLYGWHRAVGLTSGVLVLTIALTGIWMTFEDDLRPSLARVVSHQLPYRPEPTQTLGAVISPQAALDIAIRRLPEAQWGRITLPTAAQPVYTIRFHERGESSAWLGRTAVLVGASTGRIESVYDESTAPLSNRLIDAALPVHNGEILGTSGRILMLLTGLTLPTLYVTGVWRWFGRTRAQRLRRRMQPG